MREPGSAASVIDAEALSILDGEVLEELIAAFVDETLRGLSFLREAAQAGDAEVFRWVASGLAENSERLGAPALEDLCRRLCDVGVDELEELAFALVADLEQEFDRVRMALARFDF